MNAAFLNGRIQIEDQTLRSDLERINCEFCGHARCCYSCDQSQEGNEPEVPVEDRLEYNAAVDALESIILSLTVAGAIQSEDPKVNEAIQTTLDAIENRVQC